MKTTLNQTSEHIEKELESSKSRLECLESENETLLIKLNELERNVKDLPKKVQKLSKEMDNVLTTVATTISSSDSEIQTLNKSVTEMSTTINEMKSSNTTTISTLQKRIANIATNFIQTKSAITNLETQVEDLNCRVLECSSDIVHLRAINEAEAFCLEVASMKETDIKKDTILTLFNYAGNVTLSPHYNMSTSTYTVPHDGIYLCCLMVENLTDMKVQFHVYYKDKNGKESPRVFCQTYHKNLTSCSITPIHMYKGDQLYIKSALDYSRLKLGNNSFFSCVLIKKL
ncbi:coiled-coil domain-containing protein 186 [Biomphalaria glabrata]|nr:coiled-coil domain-containing protein 186 [Biomphalaria glabrata]